MISKILLPLVVALVSAVSVSAASRATPSVLVGAARIDITPELPIRLSGYQGRPTETNQVKMPLFARAIAIGSDEQKPAVFIAVELIGISEEISDYVAAALQESDGIERARVAICATHTHTGPAVAGVLPFMFSRDLPADETARIERYTNGLRAKLIQVARSALADRKPGGLAWAEGRADFAAQRRVIVDGKWAKFGVTPDGPVDHAMPLLRVTDAKGAVRALLVNYACHCTTLGGADNFVHSDWAGNAAARLEDAHDGAIALVAIGCGADANPNVRKLESNTLAAVAMHGEAIAREAERLLQGDMRPLGAVTGAEYRHIELPLDHAVTRQELESRVPPGTRHQVTYAVSKYLEQLDAGRALPIAVPYPVQTWTFGRDLAMVFLGGEVVSEYSLRLRRELDPQRVWVNAYANGVPCYLPSKRMFPEGGYEVDVSMSYYGWPARLAVDTEDRVIATVHEMVPEGFRSNSGKSQ